MFYLVLGLFPGLWWVGLVGAGSRPTAERWEVNGIVRRISLLYMCLGRLHLFSCGIVECWEIGFRLLPSVPLRVGEGYGLPFVACVVAAC